MPLWTPQLAGEAGFDLERYSDLSPADFPVVSDAGSLQTNEGWHVEELGALDMGQRVVTTLLGKSSGIPTLAGQLTTQLGFMGVPPAVLTDSPIVQMFTGEVAGGASLVNALQSTIEKISGIGLDALQGAVGAAVDVVGSYPIVNWIVSIIEAAIGIGKIVADAMQPKSWKALRVARPLYDPGEDYNATSIATRTSPSRDWTGLFSPAPRDYTFSTQGVTLGPTGIQGYPHFAGRRTEADGEWVYANWAGQFDGWFSILPSSSAHWGFVPTWGRAGGQLWRGMLLDKDEQVTPVGSMLPTAQSTGLAMWRAVQNPYAPQIFFVDAKELGERWLRYLVFLRRGLHMSHTKSAYQSLKDVRGNIIAGDGPVQDRVWLSLANIIDGDLKKKKDKRKRICNAMGRVFGWEPWQSDEDKRVAKLEDVMSMSDQEYIERYKLNDAAPVVACRELYKRQIDAVQSVTVLYSREDDPPFRNDTALRELRKASISRGLVARRKIGLVDTDMIQESIIVNQATQLEMGEGTAAAYSAAQKSATYQLPDVWLGEGAAPARWSGIDPAGSGGGGAGLAIAAGLGLALLLG